MGGFKKLSGEVSELRLKDKKKFNTKSYETIKIVFFANFIYFML